MSVLALIGSPSENSRTAALVDVALRYLNAYGFNTEVVTPFSLPAEDLLYGRFNSLAVQQFLQQVQQSHGLIVATPVYKAAYSGALKTLLDLIPERGLHNKVVLPIATGGTAAHMLAVDYALKPVLTALKAGEILPGVFAIDKQITRPSQAGELVGLESELTQRLDLALDQFVEQLHRRFPRPLEDAWLSERVRDARVSV